MVVNKSCVAACQKSVRMTVESVSGCSWNECPDQRGITVRMRVEWVSESAWNPHDHYNSQALVMGGLAATLQKCGDALTGIARTPWRVYVEAVVGSKMLGGKRIGYVVEAVSYTHLTLPTICSV